MKMKHSAVLPLAILGCLLHGLTVRSGQAASILWNAPANIVGDSDVSTNGILLSAVNPGSNISGGVATTVNGVNFAAFGPQAATSATDSSGRFTLAVSTPGYFIFSTNQLGSASPPFSALSPSYQTLLSYVSYASNSGQTEFTAPITMTINGLTPGTLYEFQWWINDSRPFTTGPVTATSGASSLAMDPNTTNAAGGLGQHAIGTFFADSSTQTVVFSTTGNAVGLSGYQLRQLPEPGSAALALAGLVALMTHRIRQRA